MFVAICVLTVVVLGTANAQTFSLGNCDPNIKTMRNLDRTKYAGKWYEIQRSHSNFEEHVKCFSIIQEIKENLDYDVNGTFVSTLSNKVVHITNMAANLDLPEYPERMTIRPGYISDTQSIWILHTDYNNFGVGYSCMNAYHGKLEVVWITARTKQLNEMYVEKAQQILKERGLNFKMIATIQDCDF